MRNRLLTSIASTIEDYRAGEVERPTPKHVNRWINQFNEDVQIPMLVELDHVLKKTYFRKVLVEEFIEAVITSKKIAGDDPCSFWENVKFLDIQGGGNSQTEMLKMFNAIIQNECNFGINVCGNKPKSYIYLDDAIFTGSRIRSDLITWIEDTAPSKAKVHVIVIAIHRGGQWFAEQKILEAARRVNKDIDITWWRYIEIEDRKSYISVSDVLRPVIIPDDELTQQYVQTMRYPSVLRVAGNVGGNSFFSSEEGRHLLEQEFLMAGLRIREMCPHLNNYMRPLGNMVLETLGFGTMLVTFRNCPNNSPLALWAGDPWYPLFPRKVN